MKRSAILWALLSFACINAWAQGFERVYPDPGGERGILIRSAGDSLHVLIIEASSLTTIRSGIIDNNYDISYHNATYDTSAANQCCTRVAYGAGNTTLIASNNGTQYDLDATVAKYDAIGNLIWANTLTDTLIGPCRVIAEGEHKSVFVLTGVLGSTSGIIFKLDSSGNRLWSQLIDMPTQSFVPLPDGGCMIQGRNASINQIDSLMRLDNAGNYMAGKTGLTNDGYGPKPMMRTQDGGFITVARLDSVQTLNRWQGAGVVNKYDSTMNAVWQYKAFGGKNYDYYVPQVMMETDQGDLIIASFCSDTLTGDGIGVYMVKLRANGQEVWHHQYVIGKRSPSAITQDDNGNIYIWGNIQYPNFDSDSWLMMTDSMGILSDNSLSGVVFYEDTTTCNYDHTERLLPFWLVSLEGTYVTNYMSTNSLGEYYVQTLIDSYTVNMHPPSPYWDPCVVNEPHVFTNYTQHDTLNLGALALIECPWLEVSVGGYCRVRPGMSYNYTIKYCNYGTQMAGSQRIDFTLPIGFNLTSVSVPYNQNGQLITIFTDSIDLMQCSSFKVYGYLDTMATPGTALCVFAEVLPGDICLANYTGYSPSEFSFCSQVVASFDPNQKTTTPIGEGAAHYIPENTRMNYNIQFQNTGTDTAFRVVIIDTLPPQLDITSFKAGASSHNYSYEISGKGIVRFIFDPIILPDSNVNYDASNGYVAFSINQQQNLPVGTVIENTAAIYFDFNEAVITEPWINTIGSDVGIEELISSNQTISIYPNPGSGRLTVSSLDENIDRIEVYDMVGRLLLTETPAKNHTQTTLDISDLLPGIKFIRVQVGGQTITLRYIHTP